jgi:predicted TIM-barrel fold metal-dependent hydrolase
MIIDAHAHIFNPGIIENVAQRVEMVNHLQLEIEEARIRTGVKILEEGMRTAGVEACLVLPTASPENISKTNSAFINTAAGSKHIYTAGTLHPDYIKNRDELRRFKKLGIRAIKLCSFSQGFPLDGIKTIDLFNLIREENLHNNCEFFVILDTFYNADKFFGTPVENNTTPALLGELVRGYPEINFIGAHMGGLDAPINEIYEHLSPRDNFFLDTSNAAHTLDRRDFIKLLKIHGPEHIAFGTDWPWFGYTGEIQLIERLCDEAGYSEEQKAAISGGNIARLLGIENRFMTRV